MQIWVLKRLGVSFTQLISHQSLLSTYNEGLGTAASARNSAVSHIVPSFNPGVRGHIGKGVNPKLEYRGTALYGLLEVIFPGTSFLCSFARILVRLFLRELPHPALLPLPYVHSSGLRSSRKTILSRVCPGTSSALL